MGRRTWDSLPQRAILRDRRCVVLSRTVSRDDGAQWIRGLDELVLSLDTKVFFIGGPDLIARAIDNAMISNVCISRIPGSHLCDTHGHCIASRLRRYFEISSVHLGTFTKIWYRAIPP